MQRQVPVDQSEPPLTRFQNIAADFFDLSGVHYLITVDRLSGWLDVTRAAADTAGAGAKGLIACLRLLFTDKGIPEVLSSDGGTKFTAAEMQEFLARWKVQHSLSSAHYPQSNGRAEVAVKSATKLKGGVCVGYFSIANVGPERLPFCLTPNIDPPQQRNGGKEKTASTEQRRETKD